MPPIDLCISLNGPLVDVLLPLALETLHRHDTLEGVRLHLVDKDCTEPVKRYLFGLQESGQATVHQFQSPPRFKHPSCPILSAELESERDVVNGTVTTLDWMTKNCGSEEWVFIMHFDVEFLGPWLSYLRGKIDSGVGQIGDHACALVGYNRTALRQAEVGFHSMSGYFMTVDHYGNSKVRHGSDVRCVSKVTPIHGFDTNELLELNLQHWGWKVIADTDVASNRWRVHNGSGSGRCGDIVNKTIRQRAQERLDQLNIQPII